jgi:hypothetical protein
MTTASYTAKKDGRLIHNVRWGNGEGWWEGSSFLALTIAAVCNKLREDGHGAPSMLLEGDTVMPEDADLEKSFEKWDEILETIADGFTTIAEVDSMDRTPEQTKLIENAWDLLETYFECLWD